MKETGHWRAGEPVGVGKSVSASRALFGHVSLTIGRGPIRIRPESPLSSDGKDVPK